MTVTVTDDTIAAMKSFAPRTLRTMEILKEYFHEFRRWEYDITEHVHQWGTLGGSSTMESKNWKIPGLVFQVKNENNFFSRYHADAIWNSMGPILTPEECLVRFKFWVLSKDDTVKELVRTYYGRIFDAVIRIDATLAIVEIKTRMIHDTLLLKRFGKTEGDTIVLEETSGW